MSSYNAHVLSAPILIILSFSGCTEQVRVCEVIDKTPDNVNRVEVSSYFHNVRLASLQGGEKNPCNSYDPGPIPQETLRRALEASLKHRAYYSSELFSRYTLDVVMDPVRQDNIGGLCKATVVLKATLHDTQKNTLVFNERFEATRATSRDDSFWFPTRAQMSVEQALLSAIRKLMKRLEDLAVPPSQGKNGVPSTPRAITDPPLL